MIKSILTILLTVISISTSNASQPSDEHWADSLALASNAKDSLETCLHITQNAVNSDTVYKYSVILTKLAAQQKDTLKLACAHLTIGWSYYYKNNYDSALVHYIKVCDLVTKPNKKSDKKRTRTKAMAYYNLASTYDMLNNMNMSIAYYEKAMQTFKELNDSSSIALIYRSLAKRIVDMKQYGAASMYLQEAIAIDRATNDSISLADDLYTLITLKFEEDKFTISRQELALLDQAADTIKMLANAHKGHFESENTMYKYCHAKAILLSKHYEFDKQQWMVDSAYKFCDRALNFGIQAKATDKIVEILLQKAKISYISQNSRMGVEITDQLKERFLDSLGLQYRMLLYKIASQCHEGVRDFERAYIDICEYIKCYMEYVNQLNIMQAVEFSTNMKIDELNSTHQQEHATQQKEIDKQNSIIIVFCILAVLTVITFIVLLRIIKLKRSNLKLVNEQNQKLSRQQDEIIAQRNTIEEQRQASERANLIMFQSIRYAQHIQNAALPSEENLRHIFPDHFVYYEPKDIVSGDFYYATQNAGLDIFVLADCTGHGVPGGFLSMLGISAIKELLKNPEIDIMPGIILDMMREYIKQALSNDEDVAEAIAKGEESFATADGMDMSIVAYDKYNHQIRFAGAYQNLYIARNGEITRLRGDRMPVGRHINESASFQTKLFNTQKGDMIYMTSDGIPSQIGFSGVKFMSKRLIDFFKSNYALPCETQKRNITNIMNDWLFGAIQIDDLSLVGIRITE